MLKKLIAINNESLSKIAVRSEVSEEYGEVVLKIVVTCDHNYPQVNDLRFLLNYVNKDLITHNNVPEEKTAENIRFTLTVPGVTSAYDSRNKLIQPNNYQELMCFFRQAIGYSSGYSNLEGLNPFLKHINLIKHNLKTNKDQSQIPYVKEEGPLATYKTTFGETVPETGDPIEKEQFHEVYKQLIDKYRGTNVVPVIRREDDQPQNTLRRHRCAYTATYTIWLEHYENESAAEKIKQKTIVFPEIQGAKGAELINMSQNNIPVPDGFVFTTELYKIYNNLKIESNDDAAFLIFLKTVDYLINRHFFYKEQPFFYSLRSSPVQSNYGFYCTVVNIGFNDQVLPRIIDKYGIKFAYMNYLELIISLAEAQNVDKRKFAHLKEKFSGQNAKEWLDEAKSIYQLEAGKPVPQDHLDQLEIAIREQIRYSIPFIIQEMKYGNLNEVSGSGVVQSHNRKKGSPGIYGQFGPGLLGTHVVSPGQEDRLLDIFHELRINDRYKLCYQLLEELLHRIVTLNKFPQQVEFVAEYNPDLDSHEVWTLQTRNMDGFQATSFQVLTNDLLSRSLIDPSRVPAFLLELKSKLPQVIKRLPEAFLIPQGTEIFTGYGFNLGAAQGIVTDKLEKIAQSPSLFLAEESKMTIKLLNSLSDNLSGLILFGDHPQSHIASKAVTKGIPTIILGSKLLDIVRKALIDKHAVLDSDSGRLFAINEPIILDQGTDSFIPIKKGIINEEKLREDVHQKYIMSGQYSDEELTVFHRQWWEEMVETFGRRDFSRGIILMNMTNVIHLYLEDKYTHLSQGLENHDPVVEYLSSLNRKAGTYQEN